MPYCAECGTAIDEAALFCPECGTKVESRPLSNNTLDNPTPTIEVPQQIMPNNNTVPQFNHSQPPMIVTQVVTQSNRLGTAGFVCSILALVAFFMSISINPARVATCVTIGGILWILGLIFSLIGVFRHPKGLAIAGLVISSLPFFVLYIFS